jgi:Flp pilus assembly protein TadG
VISDLRSKGGAGERASAAVEFAMVLPLVLLMALALVQVGLLVKDQLVVAGAARAGAREAAVTTDDAAASEAAVRAAATLQADQLEVAIAREGGSGSPVTVTVSYREPPRLPLVAWLFPSDIRLSFAATFRQEMG